MLCAEFSAGIYSLLEMLHELLGIKLTYVSESAGESCGRVSSSMA